MKNDKRMTREERRRARYNLINGLLFGAIIMLIPVASALVDMATDAVLF